MAVLSALRRRLEPPSRKRREQAWADRIDCYRETRGAGPPKGDPRVVRREIGGVTWYLPYPDAGLGRLLSRDRPLPSLFEIEQSRRLGARGGVMLDIGANIGTTAIPRVRLGHFRRAYAAEPAALEYACLVHNAVANGAQGLVLPDRCAIYSSTGTVRFFEKGQTGVHRISLTRRRAQDVPCYTLDDWLVRCGLAAGEVDFVKCDAQGAEAHILAGAGSLLARRRAIWQLEYWPHGLRALDTTEADLQVELGRWFTDFVVLGRRGDGGGVPRVQPIAALGDAIARLELPPRGFTNLLLYPTSRAAIRGSSG